MQVHAVALLQWECKPWRIEQLNTVDTVLSYTLLLVFVVASCSKLAFALSMFMTVMTGLLFLKWAGTWQRRAIAGKHHR